MVEGVTGSSALPRLLYIADVPVENSLHGSSLLYRLLQRYPKDRLLIVETGAEASLPERRLPGVAYRFVRQPLERLRRTRLSKIAGVALTVSATLRIGAVRKAIAGFSPDAVLTVTNGDTWRAAIAVARALRIPYHLICHDEWVRSSKSPAFLYGWKNRIFAAAYRGARSRLCVSPAMTMVYAERYGAAGETLYPARSPTAVLYDGISPRLFEETSGRVIAFAGSMNTGAMVEANVRLAEALEPIGGTLMIFGPATVEAHPGLRRSNVVMRGLLPPEALNAALRSEVDALFLPMWFGADEKENERLCFPSKLTEYTSVGLPILVSGDEECAATVWERANPGAALVQTSQATADIAADVARLFEDRPFARALATRAKAVGDTMFAADAAQAVFYRAISAATPY